MNGPHIAPTRVMTSHFDKTADRQSRVGRLVRRWAAASPGTFAAVVAVAAAAQVAAVVVVFAFGAQVLSGLPDRDAVRGLGEMPQATMFFDAHDEHAFQIFDERRIEVPLESISPHLVNAVVAFEDQRFYDHRGIDTVRVAGAFRANWREGRRAQGASTLTQQLARQSLLSSTKTYTRKLQEMVLALRIERDYTKEQILELYLNKVYFGGGFHGAEAASLGYFGKTASELTVGEAALLAGLVRAPSSYAPTVYPDRAVARRDLVLGVMHATGMIDEAALGAALEEPLELRDGLLRRAQVVGQYFREQARLELVERFGRDRVYQGGLRVFTTLDPPLQRVAEATVAKALADLDTRLDAGDAASLPQVLQGALVAIDPSTGHVRAMVGGRNFADSSFNRAVQARRQPGSTFKPFVYAAALEQGYTPASLIDRLDDPIQLASGAWTPDDSRVTATAMTMRDAIKVSSNRAAVRMLQDLGIQHAVRTASTLGVGEMPAVPSLALGSGEVTLQAITGAFGVFANGGVQRTPVLIRRVEDAAGNVLFQSPEDGTQVISPATAFQMASMLAGVIDGGTGWRVRQLGFRLPAAGKTGTTNDYHDAWFIGFTPSLVTGVWVGFDQPRPIMRRGYAGDVAVPMWTAFMKEATKGHKAAWLKAPDNLTRVSICRVTGLRAGEGCDEVRMPTDDDGSYEVRSMVFGEYFVRGTAPRDTCEMHQRLSIINRFVGWFKR
jgi:1A family penicillin-binding protein